MYYCFVFVRFRPAVHVGFRMAVDSLEDVGSLGCSLSRRVSRAFRRMICRPLLHIALPCPATAAPVRFVLFVVFCDGRLFGGGLLNHETRSQYCGARRHFSTSRPETWLYCAAYHPLTHHHRRCLLVKAPSVGVMHSSYSHSCFIFHRFTVY